MWKTAKLPQFKAKLDSLVHEHKKLVDEPLHLAVTYHANRNGANGDIFLLEVVGQLDRHSLTPDPDLFEVTYEATPDYATGFDHPLHLILTNESELIEAVEGKWPTATEFVNAFRKGNYEVLHEDAVGKRILNSLPTSTPRRKSVARG